MDHTNCPPVPMNRPELGTAVPLTFRRNTESPAVAMNKSASFTTITAPRAGGAW